MNPEIHVQSQVFIVCPRCGRRDRFRIDHLEDGRLHHFGPWTCGIECSQGISGIVHADESIEITLCEGTPRRAIASLLQLRSNPKILAVVEDVDYAFNANESEEQRLEHMRYFYDEHTCPTNYLRDIVEIIENGESDPHGLFQFVRAVPWTSEMDNPDYNWQNAFVEFK